MPNLYAVVTLAHVSADIVFAAGLLADALAVTALSREPAAALARHGRLVAALRKWDRRVTTPALGLVWLLGLWLAWTGGWFGARWLDWKLVLVVVLSALHGRLSRALRELSASPPRPAPRALGVAPPLVTCALAVIVWLALVKPF